MDHRAALIFLCMLIARAACRHVRVERDTEAVNKTMQLMKEEIHNTLTELATSTQIPNIPCQTQSPQEQHILTSDHLSSFGCFLEKVSAQTQRRLSTHLRSISHIALEVVEVGDKIVDCSSTSSQNMEDTERLAHIRCELQRMEQRLSSATYRPSA